MPTYHIDPHGDGLDRGPMFLAPTHEITVTWDEEAEKRPTLLPPGALIRVESDTRLWQVLYSILHVTSKGDEERFSYLVKEMKWP